MLSHIAVEVARHSARIKRIWAQSLSKNAIFRRRLSCASLARFQDKTLEEFQTVLLSTSLKMWLRLHEPHSRELRGIGDCAFVSALSYFATGEQAIFAEVSRRRDIRKRVLMAGRRRWRFFAQREIDAQCNGCRTICALIRYPRERAAAAR